MNNKVQILTLSLTSNLESIFAISTFTTITFITLLGC